MTKPAVSKKQLASRIVAFLKEVAEVNTIEDALGKKYGDHILVKGTARQIVFFSGMFSRVDGKGYFMVDTEYAKLNWICFEISKLNSTVVSIEDANKHLEELIWKRKNANWSMRGVSKDAIALLDFVESYRGEEATVTLPVWGLTLKNPPLVVQDVEFQSRPPTRIVEGYDWIEDYLQQYVNKGEAVHTFAVATVHGDEEILFRNAKTKVNRAINILRAFAYPKFSKSHLQQIALEGDYGAVESVVVLSGKEKIRRHPHGGPGVPLILDESQIYWMNVLGFDKLLKLQEKSYKFGRRLVRAAEWMGEATKPDVLEAKFLKLAFAIEAMLGQEAEDIPDKGITARIAERSAFLLANRLKARDQIWKKMKDFFHKRNSIAHGSEEVTITEGEVEEIGQYARALLKLLLFVEPAFKNIQELDASVRTLMFSGGRLK